MNTPIVYALDFDGVLCDSAIETGMSGWKAAIQLWDDLKSVSPNAYVEQFRVVRPVLETGYEAILIMRMLYEGESPEALLENFAEKKAALLTRDGIEIAELKKLVSDARDHWIQSALPEWLSLNPLYPGVFATMQGLLNQAECFILTTKQERFVLEILAANQLSIDADRVFGLDRNLEKNAILADLIGRYPGASCYFIEDRLPALVKVKDDPKLPDIHLQLAGWGYNVLEDRRAAERLGIQVLSLEAFNNQPFYG